MRACCFNLRSCTLLLTDETGPIKSPLCSSWPSYLVKLCTEALRCSWRGFHPWMSERAAFEKQRPHPIGGSCRWTLPFNIHPRLVGKRSLHFHFLISLACQLCGFSTASGSTMLVSKILHFIQVLKQPQTCSQFSVDSENMETAKAAGSTFSLHHRAFLFSLVLSLQRSCPE